MRYGILDSVLKQEKRHQWKNQSNLNQAYGLVTTILPTLIPSFASLFDGYGRHYYQGKLSDGYMGILHVLRVFCKTKIILRQKMKMKFLKITEPVSIVQSHRCQIFRPMSHSLSLSGFLLRKRRQPRGFMALVQAGYPHVMSKTPVGLFKFTSYQLSNPRRKRVGKSCRSHS